MSGHLNFSYRNHPDLHYFIIQHHRIVHHRLHFIIIINYYFQRAAYFINYYFQQQKECYRADCPGLIVHRSRRLCLQRPIMDFSYSLYEVLIDRLSCNQADLLCNKHRCFYHFVDLHYDYLLAKIMNWELQLLRQHRLLLVSSHQHSVYYLRSFTRMHLLDCYRPHPLCLLVIYQNLGKDLNFINFKHY